MPPRHVHHPVTGGQNGSRHISPPLLPAANLSPTTPFFPHDKLRLMSGSTGRAFFMSIVERPVVPAGSDASNPPPSPGRGPCFPAQLAKRVSHPNVLKVVAVDEEFPGVVLLERAGGETPRGPSASPQQRKEEGGGMGPMGFSSKKPRRGDRQESDEQGTA